MKPFTRLTAVLLLLSTLFASGYASNATVTSSLANTYSYTSSGNTYGTEAISSAISTSPTDSTSSTLSIPSSASKSPQIFGSINSESPMWNVFIPGTIGTVTYVPVVFTKVGSTADNLAWMQGVPYAKVPSLRPGYFNTVIYYTVNIVKRTDTVTFTYSPSDDEPFTSDDAIAFLAYGHDDNLADGEWSANVHIEVVIEHDGNPQALIYDLKNTVTLPGWSQPSTSTSITATSSTSMQSTFKSTTNMSSSTSMQSTSTSTPKMSSSTTSTSAASVTSTSNPTTPAFSHTGSVSTGTSTSSFSAAATTVAVGGALISNVPIWNILVPGAIGDVQAITVVLTKTTPATTYMVWVDEAHAWLETPANDMYETDSTTATVSIDGDVVTFSYITSEEEPFTSQDIFDFMAYAYVDTSKSGSWSIHVHVEIDVEVENSPLSKRAIKKLVYDYDDTVTVPGYDSISSATASATTSTTASATGSTTASTTSTTAITGSATGSTTSTTATTTSAASTTGSVGQSSIVSSSADWNGTIPATLSSISTKADQSSTVVIITSCSENSCSQVPITTGLTVITETLNGIVTSCTTYCPLSGVTSTPVTITAPATSAAPGKTYSDQTASCYTTVITVTSCSAGKCSTVPLTAVATVSGTATRVSVTTVVTVSGAVTDVPTVAAVSSTPITVDGITTVGSTTIVGITTAVVAVSSSNIVGSSTLPAATTFGGIAMRLVTSNVTGLFQFLVWFLLI